MKDNKDQSAKENPVAKKDIVKGAVKAKDSATYSKRKKTLKDTADTEIFSAREVSDSVSGAGDFLSKQLSSKKAIQQNEKHGQDPDAGVDYVPSLGIAFDYNSHPQGHRWWKSASLDRPKVEQGHESEIVIRSNNRENYINDLALLGFLGEFKAALTATGVDKLSKAVEELKLTLQQGEFQKLPNKEQHLKIRQLFSACVGGLSDTSTVEKALKTMCLALKIHHISAAGASIVQAYIAENIVAYNKRLPSFTHAIPGADMVNSKGGSISVKAQAKTPVNLPKVLKAGVQAALSVGVGRTIEKNIAPDSAYSLAKTIDLSISAEVSAKAELATKVDAGFSLKLEANLFVMKYKEQTTVQGFWAMNLHSKNYYIRENILSSSDRSRSFSAGVRRVSNALRRFRRMPEVPVDTPYYLDLNLVDLGSGNQGVILAAAQKMDELIAKKTARFAPLVAKYYPNVLQKLETSSDVNKASGFLIDGVFNPKIGFGQSDSHREGYGSFIAKLKGSAKLNFDIPAVFTLVSDVAVASVAAVSPVAQIPELSTITAASLLSATNTAVSGAASGFLQGANSLLSPITTQNSIAIKADLFGSAMRIKTYLGNMLFADAVDMTNKTNNAAIRALSAMLDQLIKRDSLEQKTALLSKGGQEWIAQLKDACLKDQQKKLSTKQGFDPSMARDLWLDAKQLGHETTHLKAALSSGVFNVEASLMSLKDKANELFAFHQALRDSYALAELQDDDSNNISYDYEKKVRFLFQHFWGIADENTLRTLVSSNVDDPNILLTKTLDCLDICLGLCVIRVCLRQQTALLKPEHLAIVKELVASIKAVLSSAAWNIPRLTLTKHSSVMRFGRISDNKVGGSIAFSLGTKGLLQKIRDSLGKAVGLDPNANNDSNDVGIDIKAAFEFYSRFEFPNQARKGKFLKLTLSTSFNGSLGTLTLAALEFAMKKILGHEKIKNHKLFSKIVPAQSNQNNALDLGFGDVIAHMVGSEIPVFDIGRGRSVELLFRIDRKYGSELLNIKHFQNTVSDISKGISTDKLSPVSIGFSLYDSKQLANVSSYTLHGGYMSFFTTWRRVVAVSLGDAIANTGVKNILTYDERLPVGQSLFTKDEYNHPEKVNAIDKGSNLFVQRQLALSSSGLDVEIFSTDAVAYLMQKYLNAYKKQDNQKTTVINSSTKSGQIGRFVGLNAASAFKHAAKSLYEDNVSQFSVAGGLSIDKEPNKQERQSIEVLLLVYKEKKLVTMDDRIGFYLTNKSGRLLLYWLTRVLEAVNSLVGFVSVEQDFPFVATKDGVLQIERSELQSGDAKTQNKTQTVESNEQTRNLEQSEDEESELAQINQSGFGKDLDFSYIDAEDASDE